ncbi:MAG: hypothetical protein AB9836_06120 [Aminipila sp.]
MTIGIYAEGIYMRMDALSALGTKRKIKVAYFANHLTHGAIKKFQAM